MFVIGRCHSGLTNGFGVHDQGFRLKQMLYYDRHSLGEAREKELGATQEKDLDTMLAKCDIVVVNTPLTDKTRSGPNFLPLPAG